MGKGPGKLSKFESNLSKEHGEIQAFFFQAMYLLKAIINK